MLLLLESEIRCCFTGLESWLTPRKNAQPGPSSTLISTDTECSLPKWEEPGKAKLRVGNIENSFLAYSGATATPSQPLQKPATKWVSWAWEMGQTILADVFLRHISIWNRNVWMDVAQEHTCAPFYLYYLLSVFTQLLDIISLFYWQWFFFFNRPF